MDHAEFLARKADRFAVANDEDAPAAQMDLDRNHDGVVVAINSIPRKGRTRVPL
jgi:hypothetical protein